MSNQICVKEYDREAAVAYAHQWAMKRNPQYADFEKMGGDCTNFASQVLFAGGRVMNQTPTFGWYYFGLGNRAPAWTGVQYLYNFLLKNQGLGPFGHEVSVQDARPGDLAQLAFKPGVFSHSPVIVSTGSQPSLRNIQIAAHSIDSDNRPLSSYQCVGIRFIHIDGFRFYKG